MKVGDFGMEDFFDRLSAVTGISKYSASEVITPKAIVADMVDLLPPEVFSKDSRFLDPAVKSGRFLAELYRRLMDSEAMVQAFPDEQDRHEYILKNQLYGVATSGTAATIVRKQLYDDPTIAGNIVYTADRVTKELIQGAFGIMKFDVVIGNPPYNNDIYLDFVTLGHNLANKYTVMITPAKWQAKGGKKNEDFRNQVVPYMNLIVWYMDSEEVFDIGETGGITYFLIDSEQHSQKWIVNKCKKIAAFEISMKRALDRCLNNYAYNLIQKFGNYKPFKISDFPQDKRYQYKVSKLFSDRNINVSNNVLNPPNIADSKELDCLSSNYLIRFSSNSKDEVQNFVSFVYTKFCRFLVLCGVCASFIVSNENFRLVPCPDKFDHIFTDQELYQKYGLTPDEIAIIESVIKERK